MNWALFSSTFILIFLAELGDKTQLAVLSQSAGSTSKWTVFLAGTLALAVATAVGVLAGDVLRKICPDARLIKLAGGLLFLLFGFLMLREALEPKTQPVSAKVTEISALKGWLGRFVLQQAAIFEKVAADDYLTLAKQTTHAAERRLYEVLAAEELEHHRMMLYALQNDVLQDFAATPELAQALPTVAELTQDAALAPKAIEHAIEHELRMARFYAALAAKSKIPRLCGTFTKLALAEEQHAARLQDFLRQRTAPV